MINRELTSNNILKEEWRELEKMEVKFLLDSIYYYYGFDFRNYTSSCIRRRVWHRIISEKLNTVSGLQEKVLHDPVAMQRLFADFSISVTEMFRDPVFFLSFRENVIPLLRELPVIRIWHAGCSSGEEPFSMAILLHEEGLYEKTKIYATDMNEILLTKAKQGNFPLERMQDYTRNYLKAGGKKAFSEYYKVKGEEAIFHSWLAENILFAQHNLATDNSFNEFDIIVCRNVLIYFNKCLQDRVHKLFYESLRKKGILILGSKEGIAFSFMSNHYRELAPEEKIYMKIS